MKGRRQLVLTAGAVLVCAATAAAQTPAPASGGRVYGMVGGAFGGGTLLLSGAGAGLRLTPRLGLDVELAHLTGERDADVGWPGDGWLAFFGSEYPVGYPPVERDRSVTTFLTKFTLEFPVAGGRLFPFVTGGGGVGRVREPVESLSPGPLGSLFPDLAIGAGGTEAAGANLTGWRSGSVGRQATWAPWAPDVAESGLALAVGGGLDVRLWRGLAVGAEVRWLRVLLSRGDFDTAQVVSRVSYRF